MYLVFLLSLYQLNLFINKLLTLAMNEKRREVLETELQRIGVPFKFYQVQGEDGKYSTKWTRRDGNFQMMLKYL